MTDEVEDGGTAPKISSLIGVNRKRKWKEEVEEEEEQQGEESSEGDTSSDDGDDDGEEKVAKSEHPASVGQGTDIGQEGKEEEEEEAVAHSSGLKEGEKSAPQPKDVPVKKPSQPTVFVPVDRLPEIQVHVIS